MVGVVIVFVVVLFGLYLSLCVSGVRWEIKKGLQTVNIRWFMNRKDKKDDIYVFDW